ncbi:MAG: hypothetical protein J0H80_23970, partial [Rhizobiales bacterium]|nr:hypothetical protein [Hyphomicrobiales bacterium]
RGMLAAVELVTDKAKKTPLPAAAASPPRARKRPAAACDRPQQGFAAPELDQQEALHRPEGPVQGPFPALAFLSASVPVASDRAYQRSA